MAAMKIHPADPQLQGTEILMQTHSETWEDIKP